MNIVQNRKIYYIISSVLIIASIASVAVFGLNFGIDFKGGSIFETSYTERPELSVVQDIVSKQGVGESSIRPIGEDGYIIRTKSLNEAERSAFVQALNTGEGFELKRSDSVGPILGKELQGKAITSIIIVIVAIILFITFVFRKVSEPVSSFKYGLVAIVALIHDIIIPAGAFALLGYYLGFEVDALFVTALLVVLGFSVHDTIVVFDRVREHLKVQNELKEKDPKMELKSFEQIVGESVDETFTRSLTTSFTVLLSLVILYFFGAEATRSFSLALLIGILAGTYSSIFLASPLLVTIQKWQEKRKK